MATEILPFAEQHIDAVKAFNQRLKQGGLPYHFPESPTVSSFSTAIKMPFQQYFLALENEAAVRGAYILQHQDFSFAGKIVPIAHFDLPISEGYVNKNYGLVGVQLVMNALKRQPLLFSLGIGGHDEPLAQLLQRIGWTITPVPFFFKVHHPAKFLRNIAALRNSKAKARLLDLLAFTGLGWIGIKLLHAFKRSRARARSATAEPVDQFGPWADELWEKCKAQHAMCAVRTAATLNSLYSKPNFIRLKIAEPDTARVLGWAVLLNTPMSGSKQFGNMRVGSIVDCLALREDAAAVVSEATRILQKSGADLIVSNQADAAWGAALKENGFMEGPSNYLFAASKQLMALLQPFESNKATIHLNRGDGGGPMGL